VVLPMSDTPVVRVERFREAATAAHVSGNAYMGLRIHALPGLHEFVVEKSRDYLPKGALVLDVGAGSGALGARLSDTGLAVNAVDIVSENFRLENSIPFFQADLNGNFADVIEKEFDGLFAVEIIEHLENPWHFLRQCSKLIKPGGYLVLTTPNISNPLSLAIFLRTGTFHWFSDHDYSSYGHLTPLSHIQLRRTAVQSGFEVAWAGSFGDPFDNNRPKMRALARLCNLVSTPPQALRNEILVMVLRNKRIP
jgi:2-polyprenyl-3-methyl-5-hydroxy-6-metoxy-1,4-benzoquinol methylase